MPADEPIHLIVDRTGRSNVGEGEWAAATHGLKGERGWKKLHLGVDRSSAIDAQVLTGGSADDATTGLELIDAVGCDIASVVADAVCDAVAAYDAANARRAEVIVPPTRTAVVSRRRPRSIARGRTIKRVEEFGRRQWKRESGYHQQGAVENAFFRHTKVIGSRIRARHADAQKVEARIACNVLNRRPHLGRPASVVSER